MTERRDIFEFVTRPTTITIGPTVKLIIAALVVIVILLIYSYVRALGDADAGLYGLWQVDSDFADKAGIDSFHLFISPPGGNASRTIGFFGGICKGYVAFSSDGKMATGPIKLDIRRWSIRADETHTYNVDIEPPIAGIPKHVRFEYDSCTGRLIITAKKMMYARMFKACEASYYCAFDGADGLGDAPFNKQSSTQIDEDDESDADLDSSNE